MPVVLWACLVEALHDRYDLPRLYGAVLVDSGWLRWGVA